MISTVAVVRVVRRAGGFLNVGLWPLRESWATPERASPKRTREDGVPNDSGITDRSVARRSRTVVEIDHEARQEAAAARTQEKQQRNNLYMKPLRWP